MAKRGELRKVLPILGFLMLITFVFLSAPVELQSGPTGRIVDDGFSATALISGCAVINDSTSLTANIASTVTCVVINASSLFLNCTGFTITYGSNGSPSQSFGITAVNQTNITIRDCIIRDNNSNGDSGFGINFTQVNNSLILNTTIFTNGTETNYGVFLLNSTNNRIMNNTIRANGTLTDNAGIALLSSPNTTIQGNVIVTTSDGGSNGISVDIQSHGVFIADNELNATDISPLNGVFVQESVNGTIANNTIRALGQTNGNIGINLVTVGGIFVANNTILANGTTGNRGIRLSAAENMTIRNNTIIGAGSAGTNNGIRFESASRNNTLVANVITTFGTSSNSGIVLALGGFSDNNTIENNTIATRGTTTSNFGMDVSTIGNNMTGNIITTGGTGANHGIRVQLTTERNRFVGNNISASGNGSLGVLITFANHSVFLHTVFTDPTHWINSTAGSLNNFTNTTFATGNGSIRFSGLLQVNGTQGITKNRLNITANRSFLNSSNLTFMNVTGHIELFDTTLVDPVPRVDFSNTGTGPFVACPSTICTEERYANNIYAFNVTGFSSYSSSTGNANITLTKTDSQDPVPEGSVLMYTITITNNGTSNATNINLTDLYPSLVTFSATTGTNVSGNNTFLIGNLSSGGSSSFTITVRVGDVSNLTLIYNTINISYTNDTGVLATLNVTESTNVTNVQNPTGGSSSGGGGGDDEDALHCVPLWSCGAWGVCENGRQTRTCTDAHQCGITMNMPAESHACVMPAPESQALSQSPVQVQSASSLPSEESVVPEQELPAETTSLPELPVARGEKTGASWSYFFYGLAVLALVVLCVSWYFLQRKQQ